MSGRVTFAGKYVGETLRLSFDFTSQLAVGETLSSASVACTVWSGTDPSPGGLVSGSASISGAIVTQGITGGLLGVVYELACSVTTSLGQTLQITGYLPLVPDLT